jgi:hypothetical protein
MTAADPEPVLATLPMPMESLTQHNGVLNASEPTIGNSPEVYSNPFITRVYITLPTAE